MTEIWERWPGWPHHRYVLTEAEVKLCTNQTNRALKKYGEEMRTTNRTSFPQRFRGWAGELAASKVLVIRLNTEDNRLNGVGCDLLPDIEVRCRPVQRDRHGELYGLNFQRVDDERGKANNPWVVVYQLSKVEYFVRGWLWGEHAKRPEFLRKDVGPDTWFVPPRFLNNFPIRWLVAGEWELKPKGGN
jgi:hypothetical protein